MAYKNIFLSILLIAFLNKINNCMEPKNNNLCLIKGNNINLNNCTINALNRVYVNKEDQPSNLNLKPTKIDTTTDNGSQKKLENTQRINK